MFALATRCHGLLASDSISFCKEKATCQTGYTRAAVLTEKQNITLGSKHLPGSTGHNERMSEQMNVFLSKCLLGIVLMTNNY